MLTAVKECFSGAVFRPAQAVAVGAVYEVQLPRIFQPGHTQRENRHGTPVKAVCAAHGINRAGEQIVLLSKRAFEQIEFLEYEIADYREYYYKRAERDQSARSTYRNRKKNLEQLMNDIFVLDIMREDMKNDDPRLQSIISG